MPTVVLGVLMYAGLLAAYSALPVSLREGSNDMQIYRVVGEETIAGSLPYRDFFLEYPPGSLPFFVPPAVFSNTDELYDVIFANEMALLLFAALLLAATAARRVVADPARPAYPILVAGTFALCAVLLWPVAVTRYDAVVAVSLAAALPFAGRGGHRGAVVAYAALGLGAAAKLVPALVTLPLALLRRREAVAGYAAFFAVLALFGLPALALGGETFLASFTYHMQRGIQIESLASSAMILLGGVEEVTLGFGAFEVDGPLVGLAKNLSAPLTAGLLMLTVGAAVRRRPEGPGTRYYARYGAALVLAFMLGSKVLSPQYLIWLLPLVPLAAGGRGGVLLCSLLALAAALTSLVYPVYYDELLALSAPGPQLLLLRNAVLLALWALLLLLPLEREGKEASA